MRRRQELNSLFRRLVDLLDDEAARNPDFAARLEQLKKTMNPIELANALDGAKAYQAKPVDPAANEVPAFPG